MNDLAAVDVGSPGVDAVMAALEDARRSSERQEARIEKLIGGTPGYPAYPRVTITARMSPYGSPVASVLVERTYGHEDTACSLENLEIRTACAYYMRLDSVAALDAVEKAVRAPTPKAWSFITLLDRMASGTKEIT